MTGLEDEVVLRKVRVWTPQVSMLESYLCDVLGAEITAHHDTSFVAQWGALTLHVAQGAHGDQELEFEICASRWLDYVARWEFLKFRETATFSSEKGCFSDGAGLVIRLIPQQVYPDERLNIFVRNC